MDAPQLTKMERILVARYAPLNLPNPLLAMPTGDYLKYMPKFTGEGDFTAEEHLEAFYSYAEKDRKSTRLNSSHVRLSRMPSSA